MENKIKAILKNSDWVVKKLGNFEFNVKSLLSTEDMYVFLTRYLEAFFSEENEDNQNILRAENGLIIGLLERCTNIQLIDEEAKALLTMDDIFANYEIVDIIQNSIQNWGYFRNTLLEKTIQEQIRLREYKNSLPSKLDDIFKEIMSFLENDFSDEKIEKLKDLLKEIQSSPILKTISEQVK